MFKNINLFKTLLLIHASLSLIACGHSPHRAETLNVKMEKKDRLSHGVYIGIKKGNMVYQKKSLLSEELRLLQNSVYELEDRVYGSRKYGSLGLYGVLRECKADLAKKEDGNLTFLEPLDRITDKEENYDVGLDENGQLITLSEEFIKDRIERFKTYKRILQKREDEYEEKVLICQTTLDKTTPGRDISTAKKDATIDLDE